MNTVVCKIIASGCTVGVFLWLRPRSSAALSRNSLEGFVGQMILSQNLCLIPLPCLLWARKKNFDENFGISPVRNYSLRRHMTRRKIQKSLNIYSLFLHSLSDIVSLDEASSQSGSYTYLHRSLSILSWSLPAALRWSSVAFSWDVCQSYPKGFQWGLNPVMTEATPAPEFGFFQTNSSRISTCVKGHCLAWRATCCISGRMWLE